MSQIVLFGLPGAGKTYAGLVLKRKFNFFVQEGDEFLPMNMRQAIASQTPVNDKMRDEFFIRIVKGMQPIVSKYKKVVLTQTFIKNKYRRKFLKVFPHAKFILVQTSKVKRESRLANRKHYPLNLMYTIKMETLFEKPRIPHETLINDTDGSKEIEMQLRHILI